MKRQLTTLTLLVLFAQTAHAMFDRRLIAAIAANDVAGVQHLLDKNFDVNSKNCDGRTLLYLATLYHKENVVNLFLGFPDIEVNSATENGDTPLRRAVFWGDANIVKLLLGAKNIEVDSEDRGNRTPLCVAMMTECDAESRLAIVQALLEHSQQSN